MVWQVVLSKQPDSVTQVLFFQLPYSYAGVAGGGAGALAAGGGAAQAHHRVAQGHAGPAGGALAGLPQHRHHRLRAAAALPGRAQGAAARRAASACMSCRRLQPCLEVRGGGASCRCISGECIVLHVYAVLRVDVRFIVMMCGLVSGHPVWSYASASWRFQALLKGLAVGTV